VDGVAERLGRLRQRGGQRAIQLDRHHLASGLGEGDGEGAESGTHLHDPVPRADTGVGDDRAGQVGVDQEVLPERLRGPDPVTAGEVS
jgi:hypothetical protein